MFANQKCGPLHNSSTCVQCIPQMPAEVVPNQSLQLFWCVAQRPPCPPLHRAGMCSLWDSRLWERPVLPRCPAPHCSTAPFVISSMKHERYLTSSSACCHPGSLSPHANNFKATSQTESTWGSTMLQFSLKEQIWFKLFDFEFFCFVFVQCGGELNYFSF